MLLPADAHIAPEKLTRYLLAQRARNDKSKWLGRAGYTLENWTQLEADIRQQILTRHADMDETNTFGDVYRIVCDLQGPNGRVLRAVTIWMREHETGQTKFITMYPG
jgi:hypothetical protein